MASWIFMLCNAVLIPLIMICFGRYFMKRPPKKINALFGYRTAMSMKNDDIWEFAHKYCGRLWWIVGWILLFVSVIVFLIIWGKEDSVVDKTGIAALAVQVAALAGTIIPTETALKRNFDKYGNRR